MEDHPITNHASLGIIHMKKLTDISEIQYGYAFDSKYFTEDSSYPALVRIRDIKRGYSDTYFSGEYPKEYVLSAGDLLVGMDGEFNIAKWKTDGALLNQRVCKLAAKGDTNEEYLRFAMTKALKEIENRTSFVTVKHLSAKELNKLELDVPSGLNQANLANILSKIETIIELRKEELMNLENLIKARFVEMFGTYPANEMGWCTGTIRDVISEARYGSSRPAVEGGQYPYLRMNNITYDGELDLSDIKRIDVPDSELEKCTVRQGDVLFNRTNSRELVGKTCVYNRDEMMVLAGFVIRIRVNSRVLPVFLSSFLNTDFSKQMLLGMCRTAVGQANINAKELQDIGLYIPPIDLQQKFIDFKLQIDKSKAVVQKSLDETQVLFDSLMQKYFG